MLEINKNTYVSLEEVDNFITENYHHTDTVRVHWEVIDNEEKEMYIKKSAKEIDGLNLKGYKNLGGQVMAFPRFLPAYSLLNGNTVPEEVKEAQKVNVYGLIKNEYTMLENRQFKVLQSLGATKNFKFNKRQSAEINTVDVPNEPAKRVQALASEDALNLIQKWIRG